MERRHRGHADEARVHWGVALGTGGEFERGRELRHGDEHGQAAGDNPEQDLRGGEGGLAVLRGHDDDQAERPDQRVEQRFGEIGEILDGEDERCDGDERAAVPEFAQGLGRGLSAAAEAHEETHDQRGPDGGGEVVEEFEAHDDPRPEHEGDPRGEGQLRIDVELADEKVGRAAGEPEVKEPKNLQRQRWMENGEEKIGRIKNARHHVGHVGLARAGVRVPERKLAAGEGIGGEDAVGDEVDQAVADEENLAGEEEVAEE